MSQFFAIGTSHKQASVELREQIAFAEDEIPDILAELREWFAREVVILSTCNRTELYIVPNEGITPENLLTWLGENRKVKIETSQFFNIHSNSAARHLMEVAAGIDSQVIGDIQIIGQVKDAYRRAKEGKSLGPVLTRLFETALRAGKRVKTETELFTGAVSISYVAVELARKIFYPLGDQRTLVVGAGETGELTAISLRGRGVRQISLANRTEERGKELINKLGFGELLPWERLHSELHNFDIVIVATGARDYVIDYESLRKAAAQRSGNQMLIVDLAIPRNVDPRASEIPNVFCKDLNDLNSVIATNVERRREEIPKAEEIISEELEEFSAWHRMAPIRPVIADLRRRAESIAEQMLQENRSRFTEEEFSNGEKLGGSVG
ncbi:MAG: glutamyl-tRNA reductase [Candidatus Kapaibacterium sp.]